MDVTPLIRRDAQVIQNYRGGSFKISGQVYQHAVLVTASQVIDWKAIAPEHTHTDDFKVFSDIHDDVDIVLFGTGKSLIRFPKDVHQQIKSAYGVSIDVMDTGAACRTYNVLMAEGRRVAAILYPFID